MLPERLVDLLRRQLDHEFEDRNISLREEIARIGMEFGRRGTLDSSMHWQARLRHVCNEIRVRTAILVARFQSTAATLGVVPSAADALAFLGNQLDVQHSRLYAFMVSCRPKVSPNIANRIDVTGIMGEALGRQRAWLETQLDLWEAQMSRPKEHAPSTVVNVQGHGNIVQAGIHGSTVALNLDAEARAKITQALAVLRGELEAGRGGSEVNVQDVTGLIEDAERELAKPQPSGVRLSAYLGGIATGIQTAAALREAYNLLADGLTFLGLPAPPRM
jgi:hypothetical protein